MLAAHPLIGTPSLNNWAGVSEKGTDLIKDGRQIKRQKDIDHHSPKYTLIICHLRDPPHFSLVPTFKVIKICSRLNQDLFLSGSTVVHITLDANMCQIK